MLTDSLKQLSGLGAASASSKAGRLTAEATTAASAMAGAGSSAAASRASQLQQQLDTLSQWSVHADVARQLAKNQQAEQQIRQLYQQLDQLKKQLSQSGNAGAGTPDPQVSQQLQQLEQQLKSKQSALRPDLQLASQPTGLKQWQLNNKIDLLTPRKQAEQLLVVLPGSQRVQLQFAANQPAAASLSHLQQQFASVNINVSQQGPALLFSAASAEQHLLSQPWLLQGEGVRVAAGNPVQLRLQSPDGQLQLLAQQARQSEPGGQGQQLQAELSQVQQKLQQLLRQVQSERQLLVSKLNALQMAGEQQSAQQADDISRELRLQMQQGAASSMSAIMAQGNISRSLVEFALADR